MERGEAIGTEQIGRDIASLYAENQSLRADLTHLREQLGDAIHRCPVEWERPKSPFCKPHRCDLDEGHSGPHVCSCGRQRRNMSRDTYDPEEL